MENFFRRRYAMAEYKQNKWTGEYKDQETGKTLTRRNWADVEDDSGNRAVVRETVCGNDKDTVDFPD
jgi:hypothetical protein